MKLRIWCFGVALSFFAVPDAHDLLRSSGSTVTPVGMLDFASVFFLFLVFFFNLAKVY